MRCWLLVAGCWLLVAGCWLLVAGCWLLVAGCWLLVAGCWLLVASPFAVASNQAPAPATILHSRFRYRNQLQQFLNDLIRRHALRFGVEVGQHAMAQHWFGERA